jgi:hypothetical protein
MLAQFVPSGVASLNIALRAAPRSMQRLGDPVGTEIGAKAARAILRAVYEDATARGSCTDAESLPAVVSDRFQQ